MFWWSTLRMSPEGVKWKKNIDQKREPPLFCIIFESFPQSVTFRLHTGSYQVKKTGEKFVLKVAVGYIDMQKIALKQIPVYFEYLWILQDLHFLQELENQVAGWGVDGGDWNMFLEYKAHTALMKYYEK